MIRPIMPIMFILLFLFGTSLLYQNCSRNSVEFHGQSHASGGVLSADSGNGEGYGGKLSRFEFRDPANSCREVGHNGLPLPNSQIFSFSSGTTALVRKNCADIVPLPLLSSDYAFDSGGNILYGGTTFQSILPGDFDTLAANCPTGRLPLAGATRANLLMESQNLMGSSWGGPPIPGLTVAAIGSLAGLPLFSVTRSDAGALENWRRPAQNPLQLGGEDYVFSFLARPSATERALFISDQAGIQDLEVEFNLTTGAANVLVSTGVSNVSTAVQTLGGGLFISVYFRNLSAANPHIGVASADQRLGSSVGLTAFQLERVATFCTP